VGIAARPDDFLTVKEAAAVLHVSYGSVLAAIHAGKLVAYKFGPRDGTYRVRRGDLQDYITASRTKQSAGCPKPRRTGSTFRKLNNKRLLRAWREQGISADQGEEAVE
jgi:excisionase family DNA binding protein